jgi:hypothetical protein
MASMLSKISVSSRKVTIRVRVNKDCQYRDLYLY